MDDRLTLEFSSAASHMNELITQNLLSATYIVRELGA